METDSASGSGCGLTQQIQQLLLFLEGIRDAVVLQRCRTVIERFLQFTELHFGVAAIIITDSEVVGLATHPTLNLRGGFSLVSGAFSSGIDCVLLARQSMGH